MATIRKIFRFEAAHRLIDSYTKRCQGFHGHSYKVELFLGGEINPIDGMVIDFTKVKDEVGGLFDKFDHALLVWDKDPLCLNFGRAMLEQLNVRNIVLPFNLTAENMAKYFYIQMLTWRELKNNKKLVVKKVIVHETETGFAEYGEADLKDDSILEPEEFCRYYDKNTIYGSDYDKK